MLSFSNSRFRNVFKDHFTKTPSLRLEDLSREDIAICIKEKLSRNRTFQDIKSVYQAETDMFINNIGEKAEGVFLWVFLVVQSLLEGLSDGEHLAKLQSRLDSLPKDLELLFMKILKSVDKKYFVKAAEYFQILVTQLKYGHNFDLITLTFAGNDDPNMVFEPMLPMEDPQRNLEAKLMKRRLNAYTKGPLDTRSSEQPEASVIFLHRTVRDFIELLEVRTSLKAATGKHFDPNIRLAQANIIEIKTKNLPTPMLPPPTRPAVYFSVRSDPYCQNRLQLRLLRELERAAERHNDLPPQKWSYWATKADSGMGRCTSFHRLLVACQLAPCLECVLNDLPTRLVQKELDELLDLALVPGSEPDILIIPRPFKRSPNSGRVSKDIVSLLLRFGANPDAKCKQDLEWKCSIRQRALSV
jgi:hypothetical protein